MATEYVECALASGFFEDELYVILGDSSAIVSRSDVKVEREPQAQADGQGKVCVYVIDRKADSVLVEIPGQPVVGGLRTWIPSRMPAIA